MLSKLSFNQYKKKKLGITLFLCSPENLETWGRAREAEGKADGAGRALLKSSHRLSRSL